MNLVFTLLTMVVLGLVAAVAVGRIGGGLDKPASSLPSRGLPAGDVAAQDLDELRFSPALRGYRMDEVDAVMDRLAGELTRRDEEIERLHDLLSQGYLAPGYSQDYSQGYGEDVGPGYGAGYGEDVGPGYGDGFSPPDVPTQTISRADIRRAELNHSELNHSDVNRADVNRADHVGDHQAWTDGGGR